MDESFDPYRKWLGIPKREQPPNHYRLLAIDWFESDPDVIEAAADRQMAHVRTYQGGAHAEESQRLLNELSAARLCLLTPEKKAAYDADLRAKLGATGEGWRPPGPPFGFFVKGAARYFGVQCRRWWIARRHLASGYRALGVIVFREGRYRDQLEQTYTRLEAVGKSLESLEKTDHAAEPASPSPATTASAPPLAAPAAPVATESPSKSPGFLSRLWNRVRGWIFVFQRRRLLERLGRGAYEIDMVGCGPEWLRTSIAERLDQLAEIREQIEELSEVPKGQFLSPKRLAWLVLSILGLLFLLFLWVRFLL